MESIVVCGCFTEIAWFHFHAFNHSELQCVKFLYFSVGTDNLRYHLPDNPVQASTHST